MKKTIRLTESDLQSITKKIIKEFDDFERNPINPKIRDKYIGDNKSVWGGILDIIKSRLHSILVKKGYEGASYQKRDGRYEGYNFDEVMYNHADVILKEIKKEVNSIIEREVNENSNVVTHMLERIEDLIDIEEAMGRDMPYIRGIKK